VGRETPQSPPLECLPHPDPGYASAINAYNLAAVKTTVSK